jgi:hypothetical protein
MGSTGVTKTYTITATSEQAHVLSRACEILARLGIGQFRDALEQMPKIEFLPFGWHETMEDIGRLLAPLMIGNVDGWRSSLGIHHDQVSDRAKTAWDLYQAIRYRLAWDDAVAHGVIPDATAPRKWPEMMGVHYDEPIKTGNEPIAIVAEAMPESDRMQWAAMLRDVTEQLAKRIDENDPAWQSVHAAVKLLGGEK